ncbi:acyl-CoA thioesterase [Ancylomarina sp. YFZ004]
MSLIIQKTIDIRFSEVDSMGVVWHGSYVKFLEDGREYFGLKYGLSYLEVASKGLLIPIVDMRLSYKKSAKYGEKLVVEARFIDSPAAKIVFEYIIYRESNMEILAKAKTVQVFTDNNGQLLLNNPLFFTDWKKSVGLLGKVESI